MVNGVLPTVGAILHKDRTKTVPTLRTSAGASANNGTDSVTVTIDNTAQVGDFAIFAVSSKSSAVPTVSPTADWEHSSQIGDSTNQPFLHIFTRRIATGDVSTDLGVAFTFTFGSGTTDGICAGVQVWANTSGFGVRPATNFLSQADTANSHSPSPASITGMGPYDAYGGVAAVLAYVSTGTANAALTSPPTGCTISTGTNVTALRAAGSAGTCRGQAMWSGPTHAARVESLTYPAQEWTVSCVYTLSPIPSRATDQQQGPPSLAGLEVYNYSNSSGSCVVYSQSDVTRGCNTYRPWPERVQKAFGAVNAHLADGTPKVNNMAMGGARAPDICSAAFGTRSYTSVRAGSNDSAGQTNQYNPQVVTQTALPNRSTAGLYTLDLLGNDFLKLGTDDATMAGAWNASEALIRLIRASSAKNVSDASHTYTGTWTDVSSDGYMGGAAKKTTAPGAKVLIALTDTNAIDLVLIAYDDAALGVAGSTFTVKVDGVTVPTQQTITLQNASSRGGSGSTFTVKGTTSNQHNNSGAYRNYKFCQMTVSLTGIGSGSHTVTVEHAGSSGNEFVYNGYLIPAATPPWIVNCSFWQFPDATYTGAPYNFASAAVGKQTADWFKQIAEQVSALFTDGRVIFFDPLAWGARDPVTEGATPAGFQGWDTSVHVSAGDSLHQSDIGHGFYADRIIEILNQRIARPYTPYTTPTSLAPTSLPSTWTLPGTRDFTVPATGTYAIECEGGGGGGGGAQVTGASKGGGGGAYAKKNSATLTAGAVLRITVGSGGNGGAAGANVGSPGTASQVVYLSGPDFAANTVLCKADFGTGGGTSLGAVGAGGLVANCFGDVKTAGSSGSTTTGGAGAAPLGGGSATYSGSGAGTAGNAPGGGGSGCNPGNGGGAGARGVVKFT
jgi:hypothetical protein